MKLCFYCTSGRDFETFDIKVIEQYNFKEYVVKVFEFISLEGLYYFRNKINNELIITDSTNVIYPNPEKENYSLDFINNFLHKYPYAVEIYDYYRE